MAEDIRAIVEGDVKKYLEDVGIAIDQQMMTALLQAAVHAEGELKQSIADTFPSGGTGALARNPKAMLLETKGVVKSAGAFLDLVYALIQDEGGTIKAKTVKNLAIPLSNEAKVPGKWPRTWAPKTLFFLKSKRGNKLLAERIGKGRIKPHYLLKPSVTIKGKGYVERARRSAEKIIAEIIGEHVGLAITNVNMPQKVP